MIQCYIIDDELTSIKILRNYIERTPILYLLGDDTNAVRGAQKIAAQTIKPDLIFLDIEMPGCNGMDLAEQLGPNCKIIFVTAFRDYGADAFEKEAIDFLLKPFSYERFMKAIRKYKASEAKVNADRQESEGGLFMKAGKKGILEKIDLNRLVCIEANRHFCTLFFIDGEKRSIYRALGQAEEQLPSHFKRIQRSYIINMNMVRRVEGNTIYLDGPLNKPMICGPEYREELKEYLNKRLL